MRIKQSYLEHELRTLCETCPHINCGVADMASFRMFEINMDEYLDEETEWVKLVMDGICKAWDQQVRHYSRYRFDTSARRFISDFGGSRSRRAYFPQCLKSRSSQA